MSNEAPTDALRLVEKAIMDQPGVKQANSYGEISVQQIANAVLRVMGAAPASPLPGGGDEKSEDEKFIREYPEAVRKGDWERIARLLSERLRQMDKRSKAANTRADTLIAELKEGRAAVKELLYGVDGHEGIAMGRAFLARNGKREG